MGDISQPLVSVIVPAYNAAVFIGQTLKSLLNQTYRHFEVLIIDDGSTDETATIAQNFIDQDERFRLIQQPNAGVAAARNHGIKVSQGEFIAFLDADDLWHRENIEKQVKRLVVEPESVGMVFSWSADIDQKNLWTSNIRASPYYGNIFPIMLVSNVVGNASASTIRRSCLEDIGTYNTDFVNQQAQGCEDWDLYLRISEKYQVVLVPELLVGYRQLQGSMSRNIDDMNRSKTLALKRINEQYPQVYSTVMQWCHAIDSLQLGKKYCNEGCNQQAWSAVSQAYKTDWAMTLCAFGSYSLVSQLLWQSTYHLFTQQQSANEHSMEVNAPSSAQFTLNNRFLIKRYITVFLLQLFPENLLRSLRIKWIHSQICPDRHFPQSVSLKTLLEARLSAIHNSYREFYNGCISSAHDASDHEAMQV